MPRAETLSIELSEETARQVDQIARASGRSRSAVIAEAVETYVEDQAAYLEGIDAALQSIEGGQGHSSGQIFAWIRSWGTDEERPSPEPDIRPKI